MNSCISSTITWPLGLRLFRASSIWWCESHCKTDLIWLSGYFLKRQRLQETFLTWQTFCVEFSELSGRTKKQVSRRGFPLKLRQFLPTMSWGCCKSSSNPCLAGPRVHIATGIRRVASVPSEATLRKKKKQNQWAKSALTVHVPNRSQTSTLKACLLLLCLF